MHGRDARRRIGRVIVVIALGLLTTIVIAWRCAFRDVKGKAIISVRQVHPQETNAWEPDEPPGGMVARRRQVVGALVLRAAAYGVQHQPLPGLRLNIFDEERRDLTPEELVPSWAQRDLLPWTRGAGAWPRPTESDWRSIDARGWPLVSFYSIEYWGKDWGRRTLGGFRVPFSTMESGDGIFGYRRDVVLPIRPAWWNLTLDTAIFGAIWSLLLFLPSTARRAIRRHRGRCVRCGYDRRGLAQDSPCPECGTPRPRDTRVTDADTSAVTLAP